MSLPGSADVTVVIVTWNAAQVIGRCLDALRLQTVKARQIMVIDNASSDETAEVVARYPDVRWCPLKQNVGFARANNLAVKQCQTPWVALLNPDAFACNDWLEMLMSAADENHHAAAFGSLQVQDAAANRVDGEGDCMHISGLIWRRGHGCPIQTVPSGHAPYAVFSVCAAAALYRRDVFVQLGGLDEDFFCYGEDIDLGFRLRLAGYEALQVPAAQVVHLGSALTGGRRSTFSVFYGQRNLLWVYVKNMPGWMFWVFLPLHVVMHMAQIARFCAAGHCMTILRAKTEALRGLPKIWQKRRSIQALRVASIGQIWRVVDKQIFPDRCR
jgi:GT2 family glycosyltransferase